MLLLSYLVGMVLGGFYFGGLWWTIRKLPEIRSGINLLVTVSFLIRAGVVITGFYLIMADDWVRLLVCLAGFMTVRIISVRWIKYRTALSAG